MNDGWTPNPRAHGRHISDAALERMAEVRAALLHGDQLTRAELKAALTMSSGDLDAAVRRLRGARHVVFVPPEQTPARYMLTAVGQRIAVQEQSAAA